MRKTHKISHVFCQCELKLGYPNLLNTMVPSRCLFGHLLVESIDYYWNHWLFSRRINHFIFHRICQCYAYQRQEEKIVFQWIGVIKSLTFLERIINQFNQSLSISTFFIMKIIRHTMSFATWNGVCTFLYLTKMKDYFQLIIRQKLNLRLTCHIYYIKSANNKYCHCISEHEDG